MKLLFLIRKAVVKSQHYITKSAGFTLIEIIVTIGIIALLTGASLATYRGSSQNSNLSLVAYTFAGDVRKAQSMALSASEFNGVVPSGGWGIYINSNNSYIIFADTDASGSYDAGGGQCPGITGECLETVNLSGRALFTAGNVGDVILFIPPDPITNIFDDGFSATELTVQLQDEVTEKTQNIDINFLGLIDVLD